MFPPKDSVDAHGNDLQIGTNCLGPYLLYTILEPLMRKTAASAPAGSVRVAWAGSSAIELLSPKPDGMEVDSIGRPRNKGAQHNYGQSKVGNLFFARIFARETPHSGIVHACFNPGNLETQLQRHWDGLGPLVAVSDAPFSSSTVSRFHTNLLLQSHILMVIFARKSSSSIPPSRVPTLSFTPLSPPTLIPSKAEHTLYPGARLEAFARVSRLHCSYLRKEEQASRPVSSNGVKHKQHRFSD